MNRCCTPPRHSESSPPARFAAVGHRLFSDTDEAGYSVARQLGMDDDHSSTYSGSPSERRNEISSREDTCPFYPSQPQLLSECGPAPLTAATPSYHRERSHTALFIDRSAQIGNEGGVGASDGVNIPVHNWTLAPSSSPPVATIPVGFSHISGMARGLAGDSTPACCQTPQPHRFLDVPNAYASAACSAAYGGAVPSLLFTPQVAPALVAMRHQLDAELDEVNAQHRTEPLPPVTTLLDNQLYIGGYPDETTIAILRQLGVRHIVNCCAADYRSNLALQPEFCLYDIDAFDSPDYLILHHDFDRLDELVSSILGAGERVFVHCVAGVNRSVTLCAAFLMEHCHVTPIEVVQLFRARQRMRILENVSFRHQIIDHYIERVAHRQNEEEF